MVALMAFIFFITITMPTSALEWEGSSTGGGGNGTVGTVNGYAIHTTNVSNNCIGYRFSVVNKAGDNKVTKVIDIYRDNSYGNYHFSTAHKFSDKLNKKQLINNQNNGFTTLATTTNCYMETDFGFVSSLPGPSSMETWQAENGNLNPVLAKLGIGTIDNLANGDKILVEPIFAVRLEKQYHGLTVTETALYGKYLLGASSNGGASSVSSTWGFIAKYTNQHFPNALYTEDAQGLWTNATALTTQATFFTLINTGYGVGIAYTETRPDAEPVLSVNYVEVWPGACSSRTSHYGISYGPTFSDYTYANGYPKGGDAVWYCVRFANESESYYVRQTVSIQGNSGVNRAVYSNSVWYDCALTPSTAESTMQFYTVLARADWIDSNGTVLKYGTVKRFYVPLRPLINQYEAAAYNVAGLKKAYVRADESEGSVYSGQRIRMQYTYTSDNSWMSYNDFSATAQWKNDKYVVYSPGATSESYYTGISSSSPVVLNCTDGYFTVKKPGAHTTIDYLHIPMTSQWSMDLDNTVETDKYKISILPSDVQLEKIEFVDSRGMVVDPNAMGAGQTLDVFYYYKNNSNCMVYVDGYLNDGSKLDGYYAIGSKSSIRVYGYAFTVPQSGNFEVTGSVYLEGMEYGNTEYEEDGTNNQKTVTCKVVPLNLTAIRQNASYRLGTTVITSFWLNNYSSRQYIPTNKLRVRIYVYDNKGTVIYQNEKAVVVDRYDSTLVYFRWRVPSGTTSILRIKAEVYQNSGTKPVFYTTENYYYTTSFDKYVTADTDYESSDPLGGVLPTAPFSAAGYASWEETTYLNGEFIHDTYGILVTNEHSDMLQPVNSPTAYQSGLDWYMKSGYGFSITANPKCGEWSGCLFPSSTAGYTEAQYVYATFPEYGYRYGAGTGHTLEKVSGLFQLLQKGTYGRIHHTPISFPNGPYKVAVTASDIWTPAGMIQCTFIDEVQINGTIYDDWYVGRTP